MGSKARQYGRLTIEEMAQREVVRKISQAVSIGGRSCEHCGKSEGRLERHHPSYDSTNFVVLCTKCHGAEHKRIGDRKGIGVGRKNPNAGRPRTGQEETMPIRVPESLVSWIRDRGNW